MPAAIDPDAVDVPDDVLIRAAELMRFARRLDTATVAWQRQGVVPAFPPLKGQEAAQVGAGLAIDYRRDMAFATYRDHAVALTAGLDLADYYASHINQWHGGYWNAADTRFAPLQAVVAGSVLHAVGWALGRRLDGADAAAVAFLGDGASSQGDVHEAMNFAAVLDAPVVFYVQNNRWALSVPLEAQVAGGSVAARAAGYGMPGLTVDGDDVAAVYRTMTAALDHTRAAHGPVVVEAMTYRRGPHATSDDPGRYRTLEQERAAGDDPLDRVTALLRERGLDDPARDARWEADATARLDDLHDRLAAAAPADGDDMFRYVFAEQTAPLTAQAAQWREEHAWSEEEAHA